MRYPSLIQHAGSAWTLSACFLASAWSENDASASASIHAFHIGNSLTYGVLTLPHASEILSTRDSPYIFGMQLLWGAPLSGIAEKHDAPSVKSDAYGTYPHALSSFVWDVVTLQPSFAVMEGPRGDLAMSLQFISLVMTKSPEAQIYIYETWPTVGEHAQPGTYATMWGRNYTPGSWDKALYSHDYCSTLVEALRTQLRGRKPVLMIPVGHVLAALDAQAKAGAVPGITAIETLYRDGTHLDEIGNFTAICTWYAVLRKANPSHISEACIPGTVSPPLAKVIEETVWKTVTSSPMTGVKP